MIKHLFQSGPGLSLRIASSTFLFSLKLSTLSMISASVVVSTLRLQYLMRGIVRIIIRIIETPEICFNYFLTCCKANYKKVNLPFLCNTSRRRQRMYKECITIRFTLGKVFGYFGFHHSTLHYNVILFLKH